MSTAIQRSFAGGELAPALHARADLTKYATGGRTILNFEVMRHGGVQNRAGSEFVSEVGDSERTVRLIPFVASSESAYILEFGHFNMRVIRDGVLLGTDLTITGITNADPCVVSYTGNDPSDNDEVSISGIVGDIGDYLNNRNFKIANVDTGAKTFELQYMYGGNVDSTSFGDYTSGGTAKWIFELETPYDEINLVDLKYDQSADVMTLTHPDIAPQELSHNSDVDWEIDEAEFAPGIEAPTNTAAAQGGSTGSSEWNFQVTSIDEETYEESLPSDSFGVTDGNASVDSTNYIDVTWDAVSGAGQYNIYKESNGVFGLIGIANGTSFRDIGQDIDTTVTPPVERNPFETDYPSTSCYYQQRHMFACTNDEVEKVWGSKSGMFGNFTRSTPLRDDDAVTFNVAATRINKVNHLVPLRKLIILTDEGEWAANGDSAGILKPAEINPIPYSYNGSSSMLAPLIIGNTALYVQAGGAAVFDLGFDLNSDGYDGDDLSIFSAHLFDKYSLVDWSYEKRPHSIVRVVRDDGVLLGLTYVKKHQIFAWHRHEFENGFVENVATIPEGTRSATYLVIRRTIDGRTVRYIERLSDRRVIDIADVAIMDSFLTYDGRNTGSTTMTISTGATYTVEDDLTVTASGATFAEADVGKAVIFDDNLKITITAYTSPTVVTGTPNKTVDDSLQATATTDWSIGVQSVKGLWHLEGEDVSVIGDVQVKSSPNNPKYETLTVENGQVSWTEHLAVVHVGLPITADLETLNLDTVQAETLIDKQKLINQVWMHVEDSLGGFVGMEEPTDEDDITKGLQEIKTRDQADYDPTEPKTGVVDVQIDARWDNNGRVFVRQVDPLPLAVLSIAPSGFLGGNR